MSPQRSKRLPTASDHPVMMMQQNTGPMLPNALAHEVEAVRHALERYASDPSRAEPAPELREALQLLAREARTSKVPPEQLLVTLKSVWRSLPEVQSTRDHTERTRVLQRIVTICIKAYFAV